MFKIEDERIKKLFRQFGQMLPADGVNVEDLPQILDKSPISNNAAANTPASGLFRPVPQTLETNQPSPFAVQNIEQAQPNGLGAAQIQPAQTIAQPQLTETQKLLRPNPSFTPNVADEPNIITLGGYDLDDGQTPANVQQPAVSGQTTTAVQPTTAITNRPRTSADIQAELNEHRNTPAERNPSFMQRLGGGLWDAFINWGKTGGGDLGNLAGQLAMGGGASAVSPGFRAEWKKEQKDQRLLRELTEAQKNETFQADVAYKRAQTGDIAENNRQAEERLRQSDDRAFWAETARYGFDPANPTPTQKAYLDKYRITNMPARGAANAKIVNVNGTRYERQADGSYRASGLPIERRNQEKLFTVEYADRSRESFWMTDQEAGKARVELLAQNAKIEAANNNSEEAVRLRNSKRQSDWQEQIGRQNSIIQQNSPVIGANNTQIAQLKASLSGLDSTDDDDRKEIARINGEISKLERENAKLSGEITAAESEKSRLEKNPPTEEKFTPTQTSNVSTGGGGMRLTADEIRANGKKNGKTDSEINDKIAEWRQKGLLIE